MPDDGSEMLAAAEAVGVVLAAFERTERFIVLCGVMAAVCVLDAEKHSQPLDVFIAKMTDVVSRMAADIVQRQDKPNAG